MTYSELKNTYPWMVKNYPGTVGVCGYKGIETTVTMYEKQGSRWKQVETTKTPNTDDTFYANCVDAIPFFRNIGGRERVTLSYTKVGYVPVQISSISPDKAKKTVREFDFTNAEREV